MDQRESRAPRYEPKAEVADHPISLEGEFRVLHRERCIGRVTIWLLCLLVEAEGECWW